MSGLFRASSSVRTSTGFSALARSQRRFAGGHAEVNVVGNTLPFSVKNKYTLAVGFVVYVSIGMGLPFGAAYWHMHTLPDVRYPNSSEAAFRSYAITSPEADSSSDPTLSRALELVDSGTRSLEEGDLENAKRLYRESLAMKETSGGWFNLGVVEYQTGDKVKAITAWENSIALNPSADAFTNLASAYLLSTPSQSIKAIKHLTSALELSPDDPEISFNLAVILESTDQLETALKMYERAKKGGIDRAAQNIRNVGAKIVSKRAEEMGEGEGPGSP